jgi:hypothetical protein
MSEEMLKNALREIEGFYGGTILNGGILESAWISELEKLPLQQVHVAIARCFKNNPKKYGYFPSINDILEFANNSLPQENRQAYMAVDTSQLALPAAYTGMSPEESEATKKEILISRLYLLSSSWLSPDEKSNFHERMRAFDIEELSKMISTARQSPAKQKRAMKVAHQAAIEYFEKLVKTHTV